MFCKMYSALQSICDMCLLVFRLSHTTTDDYVSPLSPLGHAQVKSCNPSHCFKRHSSVLCRLRTDSVAWDVYFFMISSVHGDRTSGFTQCGWPTTTHSQGGGGGVPPPSNQNLRNLRNGLELVLPSNPFSHPAQTMENHAKRRVSA